MNTIRLTMAIAITALGLSVSPASAQVCDTQDIIPLEQPVAGTSTLCITPNGVFGRMRASQLVAGEAYTTWWIYFDDPSLCAIPFECGEADFGGENPLGVFGRMDSATTGASGISVFSGRVPGMQPSSGAQIWIFVQGHGPANLVDGRHHARQLLTPEDPFAGAPHLGNFVDGLLGFPVALSIFVVP